MRQWLRKHRRLLKWTLIIVGTLWLLNYLFVGFSIDEFFIKGRLDAAKANWEASRIKNYRMVIDIWIPLVMVSTRYAMTVNEGVVVNATAKSFIGIHDENYNPDEAPITPIDPGEVSDFTMDKLFEFASMHGGQGTGRVTLEFSPTSDSHILRFIEDCYTPPPLLGPGIGDCGFSYKVREFEPLQLDQ
jgi:hypothetical protein